MSNRHINDVFRVFEANSMQSQRILTAITEKRITSKKVSRRPNLKIAIAVLCVCAFIVSLGFELFPILHKDDNSNIELAFQGLSVTAYAASENSDVLTLDFRFFERFYKVDVSVSAGTISTNIDEANQLRSLTLLENALLYWRSDGGENPILSFNAFNKEREIVSYGKISLETGEIVVMSGFPEYEE